MNKLNSQVYQALEYFGPMSVADILEKITMRAVVSTKREVQIAVHELKKQHLVQQSGDLFKIKEAV